MITKKIGVDYLQGQLFDSMAVTLSPEDVGSDVVGDHSFTHPDGWTISGFVQEDYYYWVNSFEATHPIYGKVWGDFEDEVHADSEEGYAHFIEHHEFSVWDYYDI